MALTASDVNGVNYDESKPSTPTSPNPLKRPSQSQLQGSKRARLSAEAEDIYSSSDEDYEHPAPSKEKPRMDPVTGMKGAFPGLDDGDGEMFYGPANDGIEYLRMVRSEASLVPALLVAPKTTVLGPEMARQEASLYFSDGVYIARDPITTTPSTSSTPKLTVQQAHRTSVLENFYALRIKLSTPPPANLIATLSSQTHPITFPASNKSATRAWNFLLRTQNPSSIQLACMERRDVMRVIEVLGRWLGGKDVRVGEEVGAMRRLGAWCWGCLARVGEVGVLGSEEVSVLRELGKVAVRVLRGRKSVGGSAGVDGEEDDGEEGEAEEEDVEEGTEDGRGGGGDGGEDIQAQIQAAKARILQSLGDEGSAEVAAEASSDEEGEISDDEQGDDKGPLVSLDEAMSTLLDMIITVVGEVYGQRDLLEEREVW